MTIEKHYVNAAEAAEKLRAIHADVQDKIHDQWDWMQAEFYVEVLAAEIERRDEALKQRDELLDRIRISYATLSTNSNFIAREIALIVGEWR
jgi:hypothetical protein